MLSATKLIAIAAVLAGFTSAQSTLPTCAQTCVTKFTTGSSIGGCSNIDIKCICSSSTFLSSIACCLASACDAADQQAAVTFALNLCGSSGVTDLPTAVSCTSSIASSTSSTPSSSTAGAGTATTSSVSSAVTSSVSSSVTQSTESGSSTSASASAAQTSGAASHNMAGMGAGLQHVFGLAAVVALL